MARSRNIKPGFFENEILGVQDPLVCLLFIGLWTLADKAGVLEDRPVRIKAQLFPYRESLDVNGYLTVLKRLGFIHRYEFEGNRYIEVINFKKHQSPHHTERESTFPCFSDGCTSTVDSPLTDGGNPPDSLIHDSLIHDSPTHLHAVKSSPETKPKIAAVVAPKFNPIAFLTANGATKQAAADYLAIRRTKKAPPTETALKELVGGATKAGVTVQYALEVCCKKNWVGYDGTWPGAKPATAEKPACAQNDPFRGAI